MGQKQYLDLISSTGTSMMFCPNTTQNNYLGQMYLDELDFKDTTKTLLLPDTLLSIGRSIELQTYI